ncbi:MAG: hypothetical protein L6V93_13795 [Clostridiales bacterium]|nr:MAG: hypothetical protein L6V93_13795 [Clostridiales bacterium]
MRKSSTLSPSVPETSKTPECFPFVLGVSGSLQRLYHSPSFFPGYTHR